MTSQILANIWTKLRKFGLDYDDFPTMMENVALLLRILTINIQRKWSQRISIIFYIMTSVSLFSYLYVYVFSMVWLVYFRYGRKEIEATSVIIALTCCSFTSVTKFVFMKLYANEMKNTVANFLKCDSKVIPNTRFAKNLRKRLKVVKRRASVIWIFLVANALIYLVLPMVSPGRHFSIDQYLIYGLDPMFESPNFEIATTILTVVTGFGVYTTVGVAIYEIVIVGYNEAQMFALSEELTRVWDDSQGFYNNIKHRIRDKRHAVFIKEQIMNEFIRIRLRDIVKFHIENINLLQDLNRDFRPTLAVEFILLACAIIAELLGGLENTYLALPYTVVQLLMDCLAGQRLIDSSDEFERSLYACQWENFNNSNQRTVLLMLMLSQKTLELSAGGVTVLNYSCLMAILKSSYSTYTTLQSTVKKQDQTQQLPL